MYLLIRMGLIPFIAEELRGTLQLDRLTFPNGFQMFFDVLFSVHSDHLVERQTDSDE